MKAILLILFFTSLSFPFKVDLNIVGTWEAKIQGATGTIRFKKDSTFNTFFNKKAFTSGRYTFSNDTLTWVEENGCIDKNGDVLKGVYKIDYFATDSIEFTVIYDSCRGRKQGLNFLKMGRVKVNPA